MITYKLSQTGLVFHCKSMISRNGDEKGGPLYQHLACCLMEFFMIVLSFYHQLFLHVEKQALLQKNSSIFSSITYHLFYEFEMTSSRDIFFFRALERHTKYCHSERE